MVRNFFYEFFSWIMLFVILLNISQRKIPHSDGKRKASLLIAVDFLIIYVLVIMCSTFSLPGWTEWAALALGIAVIVIFRRTFWPFRIHCRKCGKRMDFNGIIGGDDNLCRDCYYEKYPEEKKAEAQRAAEPEKKQVVFGDPDPVEPVREEISMEDFQRMDMRVCRILKCAEIRKSHSCYKLTLFDGLKERVIVSSIKSYYSPEEMVGKQICILANLAPRKIRGIESKGMILMARQGDGKMRFVTPAEALANGAEIG